jgi:hypothetical protein
MYVSKWESLADALARFSAASLDASGAKKAIGAAIADREIAIRVQVDQTERDMKGRVLSDQQVRPPSLLLPEHLDWYHSKPLHAWFTGLNGPESYAVMGQNWRARRIAVLELCTNDVTRIVAEAAVAAEDPTSIIGGGGDPFGLDNPRIVSSPNLSPPAAPTARTPPPKRKSNGLNYRAHDSALVDEMHDAIQAGTARTGEDAARGVVHRAVGAGTDDSKVKRLAKHYREKYRHSIER